MKATEFLKLFPKEIRNFMGQVKEISDIEPDYSPYFRGDVFRFSNETNKRYVHLYYDIGGTTITIGYFQQNGQTYLRSEEPFSLQLSLKCGEFLNGQRNIFEENS